MGRTGTLILLDTNELMQPLPRKLHAAWAELHGRKLNIPPTVGVELAPRGYPPDDLGGLSAAEHRLKQGTTSLTGRDRRQLEQQAWWARMWRDDRTPYNLLALTEDEQSLADDLEDAIQHWCFENTRAGYVRGHRDTKIICETLAVGGTILLTSNVRSIKHREVNDWAIANGDRLGFRARPVVHEADAMMLRSTRKRQKLEKWLQAGLMACWPTDESTPSERIVADAITELTYMTEGRLPGAGSRLVDGLRTHRSPAQLVEDVKRQLPSSTISTDRTHPSSPQRPSAAWIHEAGKSATPNRRTRIEP